MFRELQIPLRSGLRLVMGGSEETGMQDMAYFARTQRMPGASIVPDSLFPANHAQKGMLNATLTIPAAGGALLDFSGGVVENMVPPSAAAILNCQLARARAALGGIEGIELSGADGRVIASARGMAAHAARPWLGKSAIHMLASALADSGLVEGAPLAALRAVAELSGDFYGGQAGIACEDAETGRTTLVAGLASMKEGRIRLTIDCRLSIATDLDACRASVEGYAAQKGFEIASFRIKKPFYLPVDDPRIRALQAVYREATGRDDPPYATGGGTYSRELQNAITFGPDFPGAARPDFLPEGHGRAHEPDEAQFIPEIRTILAIYAAALIALDALAAGEGGETV